MYVAGLDIGGSKIACVIRQVDCSSIISSVVQATPIKASQADFFQCLSDIFLRARRDVLVERVGVGVSGLLNSVTSTLEISRVQPLLGLPLLSRFQDLFQVPVRVENDARAFTLGEALHGAGFGANVIFGAIIGSGVGGGFVVNGRVLNGPNSTTAEWGHIVAEVGGPLCHCGQFGCLKGIISGPALESFYEKLSGQALSLAKIVEAYRSGQDSAAIMTMQRLLKYFALGLKTVVMTLDPDVIIVGGGVSNISELYTDGVAALTDLLPRNKFLGKVVPAKLGKLSGAIGASFLI